MEVAEAQPGRGWDGGCGGADAVLGLSGAGASLSVCYHQEFGPHDDLILLEAADDLLPDLLQGRVTVQGRPEEEAVFCTPSATSLHPCLVDLESTPEGFDFLVNLGFGSLFVDLRFGSFLARFAAH